MGISTVAKLREIPKCDEHARALERVVRACHSTGKIPGIDIGAPDSAAKRVQQGFRFIPMGSDVRFLNGAAAAGLNQVRQAIAPA